MPSRPKNSLFAAAFRPRGRELGVVDEVELAFNPRSRLATQLGFILGGVIPIATYLEAHCDLDAGRPLYTQPAAFLVAGGLLFSAKTVFAWGKRAFRDGAKAAGFVLLLEGVMITSDVPVLPLVLLTILVAINGIATGCTLSLDRASEPARGPGLLLINAPKTPKPASVVAVTADAEEPITGIVTVTRMRRRPQDSEPSQKHFAFAKLPPNATPATRSSIRHGGGNQS
jgi:hypothetical protein